MDTQKAISFTEHILAAFGIESNSIPIVILALMITSYVALGTFILKARDKCKNIDCESIGNALLSMAETSDKLDRILMDIQKNSIKGEDTMDSRFNESRNQIELISRDMARISGIIIGQSSYGSERKAIDHE